MRKVRKLMSVKAATASPVPLEVIYYSRGRFIEFLNVEENNQRVNKYTRSKTFLNLFNFLL